MLLFWKLINYLKIFIFFVYIFYGTFHKKFMNCFKNYKFFMECSIKNINKKYKYFKVVYKFPK